MKSFGDNLRELLIREGLSTKAFSKQIGLPIRTLQDWLTNRDRVPRDLHALKKAAITLNCSVHYLLYGEEDTSNLVDLFNKTEIHTGLYEITVKKVDNRKMK